MKPVDIKSTPGNGVLMVNNPDSDILKGKNQNHLNVEIRTCVDEKKSDKNSNDENKKTKTKSETDTVKNLTHLMDCSKEQMNAETVITSGDLTFAPVKESENFSTSKMLENKDMKNSENQKQQTPSEDLENQKEQQENQKEQVLSKQQLVQNKFVINKNIPGLSYIIIIKPRRNSANSNGEDSKKSGLLFDCVLCNIYEKILNGAEMRSHICTKQHLLNVLEVDYYSMYLKYRNDAKISTSALYKEITKLPPKSEKRVIVFMDELESKRKALAITICQRRSLKGNSSTVKEEQICENPLNLKQEYEKNVDTSRSPKNLLIAADGRYTILKEKLCKNVTIMKAEQLNFDNILENLQKHKIICKNSVIVAMFGIYSLVDQSVVHICKRNKCVKPLIKHTLIPEMSSDVLISKAIKLHEYVLRNTPNDVVLFCEIIPLSISGTKSRCENKHMWTNYIPEEAYKEYLNVIEKYNQFVRDHARMLGMKSWNLMKNSFPSDDNFNVLSCSYDYGKVDYQKLSKYIHTIAKKTVFYLNEKEPKIVIEKGTLPLLVTSNQGPQDEKSKNKCDKEALLNIPTPSSKVCESIEFDSYLSGLAAEEEGRKSKQIVLILDERSARYLKFETRDFNNCVKIINIGLYSFENMIDKLQSEQICGKNSLFIVMCGIFSLVGGIISPKCFISDCDIKNVQYFYRSDIATEKLISMAIDFHEFILKNTVNDRVMLCELIPISLIGSKVRYCSNLHELCDIEVPNDCTVHLKLVQKYNLFVERHCLELGHRKLDLLLNSLSSENMKLATYPLNSKYDYTNINSQRLCDYVKESLREILKESVENFIEVSQDIVTTPENGQELSLEKKKCLEAEPEPEPESKPNKELQVENCQRTNNSLKDEFNLKIETVNGQESSLEEKKSSCLEAEPEPNIELQNGQELSLEEKKSSCSEAEPEPEPNVELQNGEESSLEEKKLSCLEAEPNIELQVHNCRGTNKSLKDELNLKTETMNGKELSLEEKKSSCLEPEPEPVPEPEPESKPNKELQVDNCQGPKYRLKKAFKQKIETMVKRQIDRHPSQVVLVHDRSWKSFIRKELESSVKVFNCGISNFENIMKFLKGHKILGKGSLLILMIGTYSLIREESPSICKSLKCKNQPVMRYIIPNMKSDNVISQVLSLQENLLDSTDIDQVMLCDIIPVYVDQKVMKCSNKHSSRNVLHADLYSKYLKEIEIFNDFVDIHCRSFQFENLSLLKKILPTNCNRDQNWFSSFSIADVQPRLSDFIASKIEEIAKNIQNSSKTSNRTDLIHCQEIQQERDSSFLNLKSDNENDDDDVVIIDVIPSTSNAQISTRKAEENSSILPQAEASTTSKTCNISEASTLGKHANMMKTSVLETTPSSKSDFSNKKTNATGEVTSSKFPDHSTETQSSASKVSTLVENGTDKSFKTPSGKKGITCITNSTPAKTVQNISTEEGSNTKNLISIPLAKKPLPPVNIITSSEDSESGGKLENEISEPCKTVNKDTYRSFEKIVIIADSEYLPYVNFLERKNGAVQATRNSKKVVIRNNKFDSFDDIIPLIKKEQELHSKKTLFILFTGLLNIAKKDSYKCQRIMKGLRCNKEDAHFKITPLKRVDDILFNVKRNLVSLFNEVGSILEYSSAFTILPPFPLSIISIGLDLYCMHNTIAQRKLSQYYKCDFDEINTLKVNYSKYSMGLALLANYLAIEINANNEPLEKYCNIVSDWNDHLSVFSSREISDIGVNCVTEKFKVWVDAVNKFLFNCLNDVAETLSHPLPPLITDISPTKIDEFKIIPSIERETAQNVSNNDHVVFVTCNEEQIDLLPKEENHISVINGSNYDWRDIKNKIETVQQLESSKSTLFVIFGSATLLANEEIFLHCVSANCKESLRYLDLCSIEPFVVIQNTKKNLETLTKGIENYCNAKIIFIPFYPMTLVELTKSKHAYIHQLVSSMSKPSLVCARKQRWEKLFNLFKIVWEEEMYFRLRNIKKEMKDIIQDISKSTSGLHWIDILIDCNGVHIEKPRKSYHDLSKYKLFLNKLVFLAHPAKYSKSTIKLPFPVFFLHLPLQSETLSNGCQQNNKEICNEKNYSCELSNEKVHNDKALKISNQEIVYSNSTVKNSHDSNRASDHKLVLLQSKQVEETGDKVKSDGNVSQLINNSLVSNKISDFKFSMKDVSFTNDKIPFDNFYILCKEDMQSVIPRKDFSNVEFIIYNNAKFLEIDIPDLIQRMPKNNSACLFMLDIKYFLKVDFTMVSCLKNNCGCPVFSQTLDIKEKMDSVDSSKIKSSVISKVMNVITFIAKLSIHLPVLAMPLFPARIRSIRNTMDHNFIHKHSSIPNFYFVSETSNWKVFEESLADYWTNAMENNNDRYFKSETLRTYINNLATLTYENFNNIKFEINGQSAMMWRNIFKAFIDVLSSNNVVKSKIPVLATNRMEKRKVMKDTIEFKNFSIPPQQSEIKEELKEKNTSREQNVLVIVWNHSTGDEDSITKSFNCISTHTSILKYEDHFQIKVPSDSTIHVYGILKELIVASPQIKSCVLEETVFVLMKFKTVKCEGFCSGKNVAKCFYYHDMNDKRRVPMSSSKIYKYCALNCPSSPEFRSGVCLQGLCKYSHNKYELSFHPSVYQSKICPRKEQELCESQPYCPNAHENTPEMFYSKEWKDLIVFGTENSVKFMIAAIFGFNKFEEGKHRVKVIFVSPSQMMLNIMKMVILNIFGKNLRITILGEGLTDPERSDVFLGTPSLLINTYWTLLRRSDIKALIVDDALKILEDSCSKFYLISALKQINEFSVANKVFVSECYDSKTARCISTLLEIPLQEVKPKGQTKEEILEIEAFVSSCRLQSEVGSTNSSTDVQYDEESNKCKSRCVKKSLSKSKSPLKSFSENENKKIHFEKRSSRSSSLSRKTIAKQESREHSSNSYERVHHNRKKSRSPRKRRRSRSSSKTETKKRKRTDSKSRKKAKKKSKTKNSDSFPGNKRKNHHENEERLDYDEKKSSPSEELSHVSKRKRHSSYHSSSSSNNNKLDLDKTCDEFSEKLSPSEELPHVSKRKRESLYHSSSSSNNKLDIDKTCDEFSVVGTLKLLLAVEDKLGILGSAVLSLVKSVEENEENATKMWNLFVDEENIILLNMIVDKLKGLLLTSHSHEISIITKTIEWVQKLIEEAKMKSEHTVDDSCTKEEVTIDLDSIAIASFDKSPDHILGLIKTAFAYEGKINPTKEEIHHAYLQVCYLQFELAVKEST